MTDPTPRRIPLDLLALDGSVPLFRLDAPVRHDPAVDRWLADETSPLRALVRPWLARMQACGADVQAVMHDGCPVACIGDAPFAYVNTFRRHASVGFFYGALLADPHALLEGDGKRMRHVKLHPDRAAPDDALRDLIDAAYVDLTARLRPA